MTIEQLFGTLQQSVVDMWRAHLEADKHSTHVVLDDYYKDMPDLVDQLIEDYMGRYGKIASYESALNPGNFTGPVEYLSALREMVGQTRETISASELQSDIDAILSFIDSTVYKLRDLCNENQEITFTLEENSGEGCAQMLEKCCSGGKCKTEEEEEEKPKKKKHLRDKFDKEEECEMKESYVGMRDYISRKLED